MRLPPAPPVDPEVIRTARDLLDLMELSLITDLPPPPEVAFLFDLSTAVPSTTEGDHHDDDRN